MQIIAQPRVASDQAAASTTCRVVPAVARRSCRPGDLEWIRSIEVAARLGGPNAKPDPAPDLSLRSFAECRCVNAQ